MIKEILYMGREHVAKKVKAFVPPAIVPEFYAAIVFHDPHTDIPDYPKWVKPILTLECTSAIISRHYNFSEFMGERVIKFLDLIEASDQIFTIFVQSERGVHRAPAIAKIVRAVKQDKVKIVGLTKDLKDCNCDPMVMKYLSLKYCQGIAKDAEKLKRV